MDPRSYLSHLQCHSAIPHAACSQINRPIWNKVLPDTLSDNAARLAKQYGEKCFQSRVQGLVDLFFLPVDILTAVVYPSRTITIPTPRIGQCPGSFGRLPYILWDKRKWSEIVVRG